MDERNYSRRSVSPSLHIVAVARRRKNYTKPSLSVIAFFQLFVLSLTNILSRLDLVLRHLEMFNGTGCQFVADATVDESIRIVLDFLRRIKLEPDCTASARHAWQSAISGLDSLLHIHFLLALHNFSYVNNLV